MQFELRTQVIEPKRKTFTNLVERYGDRPASRYEEGSIDIQCVENFHYKPLYSADKDHFDPDYTAFTLTDPYSFTDPRQLYYAPYVQSRAAMGEAFAKSIDYVESRGLMQKLPGGWDGIVGEILIPLRHWEAGAELVHIEGSRWAWGTTIDQCCTFAAFDRIGNAQSISRIGIVYGEGHDGALAEAKERWMGDAALQGLRRLIEELLVEHDYGKALIALDLADQLLYPLMYSHLDEAALTGGAGAYSLLAQHYANWFSDQRRWVDALVAAWLGDPTHGEANKDAANEVVGRRWNQIVEAVSDLAAAVDARVDAGAVANVEASAAALAERLTAAGLTVPGGK
ncbi:MAG: phenol 2-monooxygenase [Actinomycetales bacterium]|nr:phenol 2-monooxygenase [Actinomycetales bacterium]